MELAYRLPSLLAAGVAVWFVWRLGARLGDGETAALAALAFSGAGGVAFAAADARPYSLGLALAAAATETVWSWCETGSPRWAVAYVGIMGVLFHVHVLFLAIGFAHLATVAWSRASRGSPDMKQLALAAVPFAAIAAPGLPFIATVAARGDELAWRPAPGLGALARSIAAPAAAGGALLALRRLRRSPGVPSSALAWVLPATLALAPPLTLFAAAKLTSEQVFDGRYAMPALIGTSLLVAAAIRSIERPGWRVALAILLAAA
ncbi:MAG TPA: glycosyltransferase family 39 protein, partial [Planctomycetota bacterium]|nr:glycosyltransferase family 39 protein [Planctomycetota bacterium]